MFISCIDFVTFWLCSKVSVVCEFVCSSTLMYASEVVGIGVFSVFPSVSNSSGTPTYVCDGKLFNYVRGGNLVTLGFLEKMLASFFILSTCFFNSGLFCLVFLGKIPLFPLFSKPFSFDMTYYSFSYDIFNISI